MIRPEDVEAIERRLRGDAVPEAGWVAPALLEEFPGLALRYLIVERGSGRSPKEVRERLHKLSDRFHGAHAINLRQRPIPWAYRVFYRHIGLDPDRTLTPVEQLALERMKKGSFKSQNLLDDALTIAIIESRGSPGKGHTRHRRRGGGVAVRRGDAVSGLSRPPTGSLDGV